MTDTPPTMPTVRPPAPPDPALVRAPSAYARQAVAHYCPTPAARAALLAAAGLNESILAAPEMSLAEQLAILVALIELEGPHWAVAAPAVWAPAAQGALDVAVRSAETLGEAMALVAQYGAVRAPQCSFTFEADDEFGRLVVGFSLDAPLAVRRVIGEAAALGGAAELAAILGRSCTDLSVTFPWPAPDYASAVRAAFPGVCAFDADRLTLSVPKSLLAEKSPFADAALKHTAAEALETARRDAAGGLAARIERLALDALDAGDAPPTAEAAAAALGLSRRTLARRLSEEGATYRALRDAALKRAAARLLADDRLSREQIAAQLGFADATSFSRACRRWFGQSPRAARARLTLDPHQPH